MILLVTFRDFSVSFPGHIERKQRILLEERFDLSKISQVLPEELILTIFTDTFLNRTIYLKRIAEAEIEIEREKEQLIREERRARFIFLKRRNNKFDPDDDFKKYLDNPDFGVLMRWTDDHYKFRPDY